MQSLSLQRVNLYGWCGHGGYICLEFPGSPYLITYKWLIKSIRVYVCMYFIWRNPLRLHIIIKHIKTGISGFKPRITQESITILISTVVL